MSYDQAQQIIWLPDHFPRKEVLQAAEFILAERGAVDEDVKQATHLITTMRTR